MNLKIFFKLNVFLLVVIITTTTAIAIAHGQSQTYNFRSERVKTSESQIWNHEELTRKLTGDNLVWIYHRDGVQYHIQNDTSASTEYKSRGRFHFIYNGTAENDRGDILVWIKLPTVVSDPSSHVAIDKNGAMVTNYYSAEPFHLVEQLNGRFQLYIANEPMVARPGLVQPYNFFLNSVYPNDPPAEFSVATYILNIQDFYDGKRENILPTARLISELAHVNKENGYEELLHLVNSSGHVPGREIFEIGHYIFRDVIGGSESAIFQKLPQIVQTICSSIPVRLFYRDINGYDISMHRYWASLDNTDVQSYKFTSSIYLDKVYTALTYGEDIQLYIPNFAYQFVQITSPTKRNDIQLYLRSNLNTFNMYAYRPTGGKMYPLDAQPKEGTRNIYFEGYYDDRLDTEFVAIPYE